MKLKELKAEAYDVLATLEALQRRLAELNQAIANYKEEEVGEKEEETNK